MQRKRNRCPLILLDAAVIMGLEHCQLVILIQGILLHVQTGRVNMRSAQTHALCDRCSTDHSGNDRLATVVYIDLVPCLEFHIRSKGNESLFLQQSRRILCSLTLGFGRIQKCHIVCRKSIALLLCLRRNAVCAVLGLHKQLFLFFFCLCYLRFH